MERRTFMVGVGGTALGTSALVGSGAVSRVESQRDVQVKVEEDHDAYLGLKPCKTKNGKNFVEKDGKGHVKLKFGDNNNGGHGVNSDSRTWFDKTLKICNQGKDHMTIYVDRDVLEDSDNYPDGVKWYYKPKRDVSDQFLVNEKERRFSFYVGESSRSNGDRYLSSIVGHKNRIKLKVGECICVGVRVVSKKVDATAAKKLFDGTVVITADSPGAAQH